jgi:hypothetical protein
MCSAARELKERPRTAGITSFSPYIPWFCPVSGYDTEDLESPSQLMHLNVSLQARACPLAVVALLGDGHLCACKLRACVSTTLHSFALD